MIVRPFRLAIALSLIASSTAATPVPELAYPEVARILVEKEARTMTLYGVDGSVHRITGLQLGEAPVGPKQFEGDERTPEGNFLIDYGNPNSAYTLSLHIDYPRAEHRTFAKAQGRSAGGQIFIHGQPNGWPTGRVPGDWTDGCIAISNEEIAALWRAVPNGTPIEIRP